MDENKRKSERYLSHQDINGEYDFVYIVKYGSSHILTSFKHGRELHRLAQKT